LGGYNYGTHENEPRGYYLSCFPVHYASKNGYTTESYSAFSGIAHHRWRDVLSSY
jgi:hypothetical protein